MRQSDKLRVYYSKREKDVMFYHPLGQDTISDAHFLHSVFDQKFTDDLKRRGYDITTLKFSIEPQAGDTRFASQREKK
jgi:hypothetical protein